MDEVLSSYLHIHNPLGALSYLQPKCLYRRLLACFLCKTKNEAKIEEEKRTKTEKLKKYVRFEFG